MIRNSIFPFHWLVAVERTQIYKARRSSHFEHKLRPRRCYWCVSEELPRLLTRNPRCVNTPATNKGRSPSDAGEHGNTRSGEQSKCSWRGRGRTAMTLAETVIFVEFGNERGGKMKSKTCRLEQKMEFGHKWGEETNSKEYLWEKNRVLKWVSIE